MRLSEDISISKLGETEHSFVVDTIGRLQAMPNRLEVAKQLRPFLHLIIADALFNGAEDEVGGSVPKRPRELRLEN